MSLSVKGPDQGLTATAMLLTWAKPTAVRGQ